MAGSSCRDATVVMALAEVIDRYDGASRSSSGTVMAVFNYATGL
jgi:hypothetical protein